MKKSEKELHRKSKLYYEENTERLLEIDTRICLKRTAKNYENLRKIEFTVCPKTSYNNE